MSYSQQRSRAETGRALNTGILLSKAMKTCRKQSSSKLQKSEIDLTVNKSELDDVKLRLYETVLVKEQEMALLKKNIYPRLESRARKLIQNNNRNDLHLSTSKRSSVMAREKASNLLTKQTQ